MFFFGKKIAFGDSLQWQVLNGGGGVGLSTNPERPLATANWF